MCRRGCCESAASSRTACGTASTRHHQLERPGAGRSSELPARARSVITTELRQLRALVQRLEQRQDAYARELVRLQREGAAEYAAGLFRQALAAAVVNAAPAVLAKDIFGALAQFVPVAQNLKGGAASFARRPGATLGVPAIALGIFALRQPRTPIIVTNKLDTRSRFVRVTIISPDGGDVRYVLGSDEVTKASPKYGTYIDVPRKYRGKLRVRAFLLLRASETADVDFTYSSRMPRWIRRFLKFWR
jgi:hypothetical protein